MVTICLCSIKDTSVYSKRTALAGHACVQYRYSTGWVFRGEVFQIWVCCGPERQKCFLSVCHYVFS